MWNYPRWGVFAHVDAKHKYLLVEGGGKEPITVSKTSGHSVAPTSVINTWKGINLDEYYQPGGVKQPNLVATVYSIIFFIFSETGFTEEFELLQA